MTGVYYVLSCYTIIYILIGFPMCSYKQFQCFTGTVSLVDNRVSDKRKGKPGEREGDTNDHNDHRIF